MSTLCDTFVIVAVGARATGETQVPCRVMTDERIDSSNEAVITEALSVIDGALARMMQRELVSTGEVADLLLDVRTLLTAEPTRVTEPVTTDAL